jgi:two-component sensor histidine kinase
MKNMLTVVAAIVRQTMRTAGNLADAEAAIGTRLLAMARAHDLLLKADWKAADLSAVIHSAIEQHDTAAGRIVLQGPGLQVASSTILPFSLAFNELCTNAVKYGALSGNAGRVQVSWTVKDGVVVIRWEESGGPTVVAPARKGLGGSLIETALPKQLGGTGRLVFAPTGVEFILTLPLDRVTPVSE